MVCSRCGDPLPPNAIAHECPAIEIPADLADQLEGKSPPLAPTMDPLTLQLAPITNVTSDGQPITAGEVTGRYVGERRKVGTEYTPDPALTPEQWASFRAWAQFQTPYRDLPNYMPSQHGIAAANLFNMPFGFDIQDALDEVKCAELVTIAVELGAPDPGGEMREVALRCLSRGRRILAMLPPIEDGPR